ncbi:hypothetical protein EVC28_056 [Rhizobium phage RHph_I1_23]|nr:hypothetical protein EVC28_056 [Rhizobium phage RHph_I1_23]
MSEQLKPCPFCGATDSEDNATQQAGVHLVSFKSPVGKPAHRVECQCGSAGSAHIGPMSAMALWNRRADDPQSMSSEALAAHIASLQQILNEKRETASW